ncbi:MAG TPA: hypothetical protein VGW40_14545 [Allosphingosinicella sp.]|nr:hypothetical protein [Allosphingosinicella sp.]
MAMTPRRKLNRRSFFGQVAGGAAAAGALGVIGGTARASAQTGPYTGVTDNDSGAHADNAGHGRGAGGNAWGQPAQPQGGQTGYSDSDSGPGADPSGGGRRGQRPQTGITDGDPTDPYGQGQGTSGARTHNSIRRRPDGSFSHYTGITDSDSGATRDPANYGRGGRDCRDSDSQEPDWRNRDPVRRCE